MELKSSDLDQRSLFSLPGFRFCPTDAELVMYHLLGKATKRKFPVEYISEVDVYKFAPWELVDKSIVKGDLNWYFFCPIEKKYLSGIRMNRATDVGYWKITGKDRPVLHNNALVGSIKTLIFYRGRSPKGARTDWVMHEYRLEDKYQAERGVALNAHVLCKIFKEGLGPRKCGSPFKEEDWNDDNYPKKEDWNDDEKVSFGLFTPTLQCEGTASEPHSSESVLSQHVVHPAVPSTNVIPKELHQVFGGHDVSFSKSVVSNEDENDEDSFHLSGLTQMVDHGEEDTSMCSLKDIWSVQIEETSMPNKQLQGRSEGQTMLDPQGVWLDDKAVEMNQMTSNSSVEMKIEIKEIGYEASQRQLEFIQDEEMEQGISTLKPQAVDMTSNSSERTKFEIEEIVNETLQKEPEFIQDEEMEQAISTLKPVEVVFDVDALKMPKFSGQMEFQIKDNEMEPETDRPEESQKFLMKGGLGLTEPPKDEDWENAKVMNLMDNELSVLPENPRCPKLSALFLKRNYKLRMIPPQFFDYMPALQILNLSRTSIKSLPDSISRLFSLKRLFLNDCHRFMRLSPKVGELKQLEVLDLEGTEIMDLPHEIKKLTNLTCFEVSFYGYKSDGRKAMQSSAMVPCGVISALSNLEELNVDVNPDAEQWDACVEAIVAEVCSLKNLNMLKFYFPRMELLSHIQCKIPALLYFRFIVGRHVKRIISRVPRDVEFELVRWERCLKYINGMSVPRDIRKVLQHATAFFLDRHATVKKLSDFGIQNMEKLKCLVVGECNKLQVIIDEADDFKEDDGNENVSESYGTEKFVLGSLEYLYIYYMRSLRSIWEGSLQQNSLSLLKSLTLCTCPKLTTIFTQGLLNNLCKLEELNVEDCASVDSIVCFDISVEHKTTSFLPNLKKISLHDMPGLVSIFGGLHIAPKLEWLSFYKCPNLKNPLIDEVSTQNLKRIKGLKSWWDALEWINGRPGYLDKIFVPINIWDC